MTCANCSSEAVYLIGGDRVSEVYYCGKCLPSWFRQDAAKGRLSIPKPASDPVKKKKPVVDEEPVVEAVEEAPVEEAPVEE